MGTYARILSLIGRSRTAGVVVPQGRPEPDLLRALASERKGTAELWSAARHDEAITLLKEGVDLARGWPGPMSPLREYVISQEEIVMNWVELDRDLLSAQARIQAHLEKFPSAPGETVHRRTLAAIKSLRLRLTGATAARGGTGLHPAS